MKVVEMKEKARAFVLIEVKMGKEEQVLSELLKLNEVKEAHVITGKMDIMAVIEVDREIVAPSDKTVADLVTHRIRTIPGVHETDTMIPTLSKVKVP